MCYMHHIDRHSIAYHFPMLRWIGKTWFHMHNAFALVCMYTRRRVFNSLVY